MSVALRRARPVDAEAIATIGVTVWAGTYIAGEISPNIAHYLAAEFSPDRIASQIADGGCYWTIAELDGQTVGYAHLRYGEVCPCSTTHSAELVNLYVLAAFTANGVGTKLLRESERVAKANSEQLWLSVNSRNERAIGFYRARGYRSIGDLYFELGGQKYKNDVLVRDRSQL